MAARLFLDEGELRRIGIGPKNIRTIRKLAEFVDTQTRLAEAEAAQAATDATVVALDGSLATAEAAILALDGRIDAYDALAPFVRQDQTAAWTAATGTAARTALASYAGQTVSNPPTQAEMQTLDDAVKAVSQHLVAFINDCRSNGTLT